MSSTTSEPPSPEVYSKHIHLASQALRSSDRRSARWHAEQALAIYPDKEEPWLILAAIASPRASVFYLQRALEINPQSQPARQGMHWAAQRLRANQAEIKRPPRQIPIQPIAPNSLVRKKYALFPYIFFLLLIIVGFGLWYRYPNISLARIQASPTLVTQQTTNGIVENVPVLVPTESAIPTQLLHPTQTGIPLEVASQSPLETTAPVIPVTETPIGDAPQLMDTPTPTTAPTQVVAEQPKKKKKKANNSAQVRQSSPAEIIASGDRWIDVDLSEQRTSAFEGDQLIRSFLVSTGTWQYPTVTGQYRVYVKYQTADMSGPGYYLPDVPYVMYFYKGYGLHGTYWHNNFGTPMSHGCVNLSPEDASWLFNFASVGTLVYVHQ